MKSNRINKKRGFLFVLLLVSISFFGQENPTYSSGNNRIDDLLTAGLSSYGSSLLFFDSPMADSLNPALSAFRQRTTLDFSYIGIWGENYTVAPDTAKSGATGHLVSTAVAIPSKLGVFSLSAYYLNGGSFEVPFGNQGAFHFSYARDVFEDLYFGMGINTKIGKAFDSIKEDPLLYTVSCDLGFIHLVGKIGTVSDFKWAIAFQNLGWGNLPFYKKESYLSGVGSSLFTLGTGFSFTAVERGDFKLTYMADLSLPAFLNMRLKTGFGFEYKEIFAFNIASTLDARELAGAYPNQKSSVASLLPAFSFTYRYKPQMKESEDSKTFSELHVRSSANAVNRENLWAFGVGATIPFGVYDSFPPQIQFLFPESNGKGGNPPIGTATEEEHPTKAENSLPQKTPSISLFSSPSTILSIHSNLLSIQEQPLLAKKEPISPQKEIRGGTDKAKEVSLNKQLLQIPSKPQLVATISPNFDGNQDTLNVPFKIKDKRAIKGYYFKIFNSKGELVRSISNKEDRKENNKDFFKQLFRKDSGIFIPDQFIWNGTDDSGETVSDGIYFFLIEAWDDNHNIGVSPVGAVEVDNNNPTVTLLDTLSTTDKIFSPNDDGKKDTIAFRQTGSKEKLWEAFIAHDTLGTVRKYQFVESEPQTIVWDGKNDEGILVPDGVYHYRISTTDAGGNKASATIKNIMVSTQQTPIKITINKKAFSPNADGVNDTIVFSSKIPVKQGILSWNLQILNKEKQVVFQKEGSEVIPDHYDFDGKDNSQAALPDGYYRAKLNVLYQNGNAPVSVSPQFLIDSTIPKAFVKADDTIFSPDGDGKKDYLILHHDSSIESKWKGTIFDQDQKALFSFEWAEAPPEQLKFDGYTPEGKLLPDGNYFYQISAVDLAGNKGESKKIPFEISTIKTSVQLTTDLTHFSPNNDKVKDFITISPQMNLKTGIDSFNLKIYNDKEESIRTLSTKTVVQNNYRWDGLNDQGEKVVDGNYYAKLTVLYKKGNEEVAVSRKITVDTVAPQIETSISSYFFSPDGDGLKDFVEITNKGSYEEKWQVQISDSKEQAIHTENWRGKPKKLIWSGLDAKGNPVATGYYHYQIFCEDEAGNSALSKIKNIYMDATVPQLLVEQNETILSPNNDNFLESVNYKILLSLNEHIESWTLDFIPLLNPEKVAYSFKGSETVPESISWNGKDEKGMILEGNYQPKFSVLYKKGNQLTVYTDPLTVDVTPPKSTVKINPVPFSPDNDGLDDEVNIQLAIEDLSGIEKWLLNIYDPKGKQFKQFKGVGIPASSLVWDGRSSKGDLVFSAEDYPYKLQLMDKAGNSSEYSGVIPVDVLVIRDGDKLKVQIANVTFAPNSPRLLTSDPLVVERNNYVLKRLSQILNKYGSYKITIEGHANLTKWKNEAEAKVENDTILKPLSEARAKTVKSILVEYGVEEKRLSAVGQGGSKMLVDPRKDYQQWIDNQWQNRRVEFILEK